jgi:hypothetical protein
LICLHSLFAGEAPIAAENSSTEVASTNASSEVGLIANFHSLGEIAHRKNIFRSANPVGIIAERMKSPAPSDADRYQAKEQMQHLYDRGVRTVVSLQRQDPPTKRRKNPEYSAVALEKAAAQEVGLIYLAYPMGNSGKNSLQDMSDDEVFKLLDAVGSDIVQRSETGGVVFHCRSGKDRTGLVAAYLRMKYQHWDLDRALAEMRNNGHVWRKFLRPGASYSWHEEHLRAIAERLTFPK